MTAQEFRRFCSQRPFQPFTVCLGDGQKIRVWHHDFVIVSPVGRTAFVYQRNGRLDVIDLLLVTDVKFSPPRRQRRKSRSSARHR